MLKNLNLVVEVVEKVVVVVDVVVIKTNASVIVVAVAEVVAVIMRLQPFSSLKENQRSTLKKTWMKTGN